MKPTVESAAAKYREAKKALTKHDRPLTPEERQVLNGKLSSAEAELLATVGALIGKTVQAQERGTVSA